MKKIIVTLISTILVFTALVIYGLCEKTHHKDLNSEENPIDEFYVALMADELLEGQLKLMDQNLENSRYILVVNCQESMQFKFSCATQRVEVKKVFKGDEIQVGDDIDILKSNSIFLEDKDIASINMGFVNEMTPGDTYLVFFNERININGECDILYNYDYIISPIFSYDNNAQGFYQCEYEETNSVLYSTVKNEEFFLMSQWAVDEITAFKESLFLKYLK